jgi:hypothetical protein
VQKQAKNDFLVLGGNTASANFLEKNVCHALQ